MNPFISIIIPAYNVESYLGKCLDSILSQTYKNFEIILINDGSIDRTQEVAEVYSCKDSRLKIVNKQNDGVSVARNIGINRSSGEWIYFCDADDELNEGALAHLVSKAADSIDLVMSAYEVVDNGVSEYPKDTLALQLSTESVKEMLFQSKDGLYHGYLWTKLFRKSIIESNSLRFEKDILYNEDRLFIMSYLSCIRGVVAYDTIPIYRYFIRNGSAMQNVNGVNYLKFETDLDAFILMSGMTKESSNKYLVELIKTGVISSYLSNLILIKKYSRNKIKDFKRITSKVCKALNTFELSIMSLKKIISIIVHKIL